jgi:prevent-host-death family protein
MTMKQATKPLSAPVRRVGVAEAKSKLSEVMRDAGKGPTIIHCRGRDVVVLLALEEYERLLAQVPERSTTGNAFLQRIDLVKRRHAGGVDEFEPAAMKFEPEKPFGRRTSKK